MYRVLIADDEPIWRKVLQKKIEEFFEGRIEVVVAKNGREAATLFFEESCHIAMLDIEMPGMSGLDAAQQIRQRNEFACIIFLTAYDVFDYAKRAIGVHALEYLLKPSTDEEIIAVLEEAVQRTLRRDLERGGMQAAHEAIISVSTGASHKALIQNYIEQHYQEDIAIQDVAAAINYSDAYFCKVFKENFEKSFVTYLKEFRVQKAKCLLADVRVPVKDVSIRVGYRDSSYFTRVFKRLQGETPSEYRARILGEKEGGK